MPAAIKWGKMNRRERPISRPFGFSTLKSASISEDEAPMAGHFRDIRRFLTRTFSRRTGLFFWSVCLFCAVNGGSQAMAGDVNVTYLHPVDRTAYERVEPKELPPCDEKQYAAYSDGKYPPPSRSVHPPHKAFQPHPDAHPQGWCGVGCWFYRLRSGYCGRGCDYYLFRLYHFPEGKLHRRGHKKLACR